MHLDGLTLISSFRCNPFNQCLMRHAREPHPQPQLASSRLTGQCKALCADASETQKRPGVGIGVIVCRGDSVLIGERRGAIGKGGHSLPGGHLEWGETFESCAAREVKEETGLDLQNITYVTTLNSIFGNFHYVTIFLRGTVPEDAEAENLEPTKCVAWKWVSWNTIPKPVFEPLQQLILTGYNPFQEGVPSK